MASINGLKLKNYKVMGVDHEGCAMNSGTLYKGSKKLGIATDDSWGGPMNFNFDSSILGEYVKAYDRYRPCPWGEWDEGCLVAFLAELNTVEKIYKKYAQKGYPTLIYLTDGINNDAFVSKETDENVLRESDAYKNLVKKFEEENKGNSVGETLTYFYKSLEDFDIEI